MSQIKLCEGLYKMTQSPNNMFFDFFKQFTNTDNMQNFSNNFSNLDYSNYAEIIQKNIDAMMKASQINLENSQAIAKRVGEIYQKHAGEFVEVSKDIMTCQNPEQAMQKHQDFVKETTNNVITNSKEVVEMTSKALMEVYDIFKKVSETASQAPVKKSSK